MIERGITKTKADFWVHFFPFEKKVYWYLVRHMREHITRNKPIVSIGKSKDGTETGRGYLIPKSLPFVIAVNTPDQMVNCFDWSNSTDREAGLLWGEQVIDWMSNTGLLRIPWFSANRLTKKNEQYDLGDFGVQFYMPRVELIEVKTEKLQSSGNLFVQTHERGHRVNQIRTGSTVKTRVVSAPALD